MGSKYSAALKIRGDTVEEGEWDEVVVVHYASLEHFADMLGGSDYQEINKRLKMGSLRDTCNLLTTGGVGLEDLREGYLFWKKPTWSFCRDEKLHKEFHNENHLLPLNMVMTGSLASPHLSQTETRKNQVIRPTTKQPHNTHQTDKATHNENSPLVTSYSSNNN